MTVNKKHKRKAEKTSWLVHIFFILFGLVCLIPFITVISISLTNEIELANNGFSIFPGKADLTAYRYLLENPKIVIDAYKITIFITVVGTFLSTLLVSMAAYSLSRKRFILRKVLNWYLFIPTLFGGGLAASYVINTQYLHLNDNIWVLILPGLIGVFNVFMIRTFFQQLPESLFEATKMDGGSEYTVYFRIAMPLSKPVLATVAFLDALERWNSWYNAMLYIRNKELVPLQYLLQKMMREVSSILSEMDNMPSGIDIKELPGENLRMAMLVVSIGPMMCFFPFFQKYFVKGMTVGSVKG
ncbi:MAG: carbohydrate ABC transporter permease [Lachnospiraceae bacterium]|nr:carbohydrate ABC transporter permease [Lachnospiraceae bacterium]